MHLVLDPLPCSFAGVELDRLARLNRGTVALIVESYLGLGVQFCGFPEDDVRRSWWGVWMEVVAETKVYSTPTRLKFRGVGSGSEARKTGGRAGEVAIDFGGFQGVPILSVNTKILRLIEDLF